MNKQAIIYKIINIKEKMEEVQKRVGYFSTEFVKLYIELENLITELSKYINTEINENDVIDKIINNWEKYIFNDGRLIKDEILIEIKFIDINEYVIIISIKNYLNYIIYSNYRIKDIKEKFSSEEKRELTIQEIYEII